MQMITKFQDPAGKLEYLGKSGNLQYKRTGTGNIIASVDGKNWYPIPDKKGAENYWKLNGKLGGVNPYEEAKKLGLTLSPNDSSYIAGYLRYGNGQSTLSEEQRDLYRRTMLSNYFNNITTNRKGGTIKIKKKNKGKFTESAKRAGKSVPEHARDVVNDPKATKLQKRRAQFALNAKKFKHYEGGILDSIVNWVNSHNINFVNRLKDPNREFIIDWENPNKIATHKMGVGTDKNGNDYIYPEVQQINGKLIDFTRPPYDSKAGMISAEERGDTIHVKNIEDGLLFTQNYKRYYPNSKKVGGKINYLNLF